MINQMSQLPLIVYGVLQQGKLEKTIINSLKHQKI